jgi:ComF family protein
MRAHILSLRTWALPAGWSRLGGAVLSRALDAVLPTQCGACGSAVTAAGALCIDCWRRVDFIERPYCARLGLPFAHDLGPGALSAAAIARHDPYHRVRAAVRYGGVGRDLVLALKFADRTDLAPMMAGWMVRAGAELIAEADIIAPVPLHWRRLFGRRHNQSALLARRVAQSSGARLIADLARRTRATRPQTGLSGDARGRNVRGAFRAARRHRGALAGARVLLVDDVITTGATAAAVARALLAGGAAAVDVLVFARVVEETGVAI